MSLVDILPLHYKRFLKCCEINIITIGIRSGVIITVPSLEFIYCVNIQMIFGLQECGIAFYSHVHSSMPVIKLQHGFTVYFGTEISSTDI